MNDYNWNLDILQHAEDVVDSKGKRGSTATGHAHYTKNWKKSSSKESNEEKKKKETETVNKVVDKVLATAEVNPRDVKFDGSDKSMNLINSVLKGLDRSGAKNLPSSAKIIYNMKERQRKLFPDSVAHSAHLSENWTKEDQSAYNKEYYRQHRDEILARKAEKGKRGQVDLFSKEEGAALMDKIVEDQENQMNWLKEHSNPVTDTYRKLIEFMNTPISKLLPQKKETPKQPEKKAYAPGTLGYAIDNGQEDEWFDSFEKNKKRRQSFEHSSINDPQYGIPEQKKFPLDTKDHVISAIRFFNYADHQYRKELAERIIRKIHQYGIEVTPTEQNDFYKYYQPR